MLSLLFYMAVRPQDDPIARFEKFMREAKTLSADIELNVSTDKNLGKGAFKIKHPAHVLFTMKWGKSDFSFSVAGDEIVAIERASKLYREYGSIGRLFMPESDISPTPEYAFPLPLLAGSLQVMAPGVKFSSISKQSIGGTSVDSVRAKFATQTGSITINAKIDSKGRLLEYEKVVEGEGGQTIRLRFRNYVVNQPISEASFQTPVPAGFISQTLPADAYPVNVGEKLPFDGWRSTAGSTDLKNLTSGKVSFVAIGDLACEVSQRASQTVASLAKSVESKGGVAVALNASKVAIAVFPTIPNFYDPTGRLYAQLRSPGTPLFLMVSPKGLVTRVWYGFDNALAGEFTKDVLEWVDPKKS